MFLLGRNLIRNRGDREAEKLYRYSLYRATDAVCRPYKVGELPPLIAPDPPYGIADQQV